MHIARFGLMRRMACSQANRVEVAEMTVRPLLAKLQILDAQVENYELSGEKMEAHLSSAVLKLSAAFAADDANREVN